LKLPKAIIKAMGAVIIALCLYATPAQAHENLVKVMIKFHNLVHALEQLDKDELEYEIEKTIIHNLEQWSKQKQFELNQKKLEKPVDKLES
jgi:cytochrome c556